MNLEQIKDEVAVKHFNVIGWHELTDSQKAILVDSVAIRNAQEEVTEFAEKLKQLI